MTHDRRLLRPALNKKFHGSVVRLFLFLCEVAGGQFAPLPMVMQTFATDSMFVAIIGASTVLLINLRTWTLIFLFHSTPLTFTK